MTNFSFPAHYRTWQFQTNQIVGAQTTLSATNALMLYTIKESFIGNGSWTDATASSIASTGNWTVEGSSNGLGAFGNNDSVDRWSSQNQVRWAASGTNHSWIVLKQTGITGSDYYLCIDCVGANNEYIQYAWSANSFVGGTAGGRPTSSNEAIHADYPLASSQAYGGIVTTNTGSVVHVMKSADGKDTRVLVCRTGWAAGFWRIGELEYAPAGWTNPAAAHIFGSPGAAQTVSNLLVTNWATTNSTVGVVQLNAQYPAPRARLTHPYFGGTTAVSNQTVMSDLASAWPMYRIQYSITYNSSNGTSTPITNARGTVGVVRDLWWVPSQLAEGDAMPAAGTRNYIIVGDMCMPWNTGSLSLQT